MEPRPKTNSVPPRSVAARSRISIVDGILEEILDEPFELESTATAASSLEDSEPETSDETSPETSDECITAVPERRVATLLPPAVPPLGAASAALQTPAASPAATAPLSAVAPTVAPAATSLRQGVPRETYYLRLQLRKDCLADLWVRDMTPHNVLAWSDGMASWVPLLAVPELREAISTAKSRQVLGLSSAPPPPIVSRSQAPARPVSIPRPARVPEFHAPAQVRPEPVPAPAPADLSDDAETVVSTEQVQETAVAETLAPPAITIAPESGVVAASPRGNVRHAALVNWERALWLAAGVSVASAASLVFGGRASTGTAEGTSAPQVAQASQAPARVGQSAPAPQPAPASDAARVEDLPLVGKHGRLMASSTASASKPGATKGAGLPMSSVSRKSAAESQALASGFDPGQARRVLASAASRARNCSDGPASGAVQVLFAPSGMVQNATLLHVEGEGVRTGCVLRAFQEARVSQFSGSPVAVRKSFAF